MVYVILNVISLFHFSYLSSLGESPKPIATRIDLDLELSVGELALFFTYTGVLLQKPECVQNIINCLTREHKTIAEIVGGVGAHLWELFVALFELGHLGFQGDLLRGWQRVDAHQLTLTHVQ